MGAIVSLLQSPDCIVNLGSKEQESRGGREVFDGSVDEVVAVVGLEDVSGDQEVPASREFGCWGVFLVDH